MRRLVINPLLFIFVSTWIFSCGDKQNLIKYFPVEVGDKWGYVDKKGNFVINSQFDDAFNFSEGLAIFRSSNGKFGFIGEDGKYVINPIYKDASKFSEGMACVVIENGKPQYINKEGKILFIVDKADYCSRFKEGMALVKINGKYGYIDKTGKLAINAIYDDANEFSEGLAAVCKKDNKTKEAKWGFIDKSGSIKINFQFQSDKKIYCQPGEFKEGLAFVSSDGKQWGCISKEGKYEINPQFEAVYYDTYGFINGASLIFQSGNYGYISTDGKYLVNPQFKDAKPFAANNLAAVKNSDGKWGFISKEGKYEINPQFEYVREGFIGDVAFVKSADKFGIIDSKGKYILNPQFDNVKVYDINATDGVRSDYVDNIGIANDFFNNASSEKFSGYDLNTTLGQIIDKFPNESTDNLKAYDLTVKNPEISKSEMINVTELNFGFNEKTYTETPVYKTVQKYDSYLGYYDAKEIDKWDKKIETNAPLTYVSISFALNTTGDGKIKRLSEELRNTARDKMNVGDVNTGDINISDSSGVFILKNENLLVYIGYNDKKADSDIYPKAVITVINKNYNTPFDELAKSIVSSFAKP